MASGYFDYRECETVNGAHAVNRNGSTTVEFPGEGTSCLSDTPRYPREYSRYPNSGYNRRNNNNGNSYNGYYHSRRGHQDSSGSRHDYAYHNYNENNHPRQTQNSMPSNSYNRGFPKRHPRLAEGDSRSNSGFANGEAMVEKNDSTQNNASLETQKPNNRKWNPKGKPDYSYRRGRGREIDSRQISRPTLETRGEGYNGNRGQRGDEDDRSAQSSNLAFDENKEPNSWPDSGLAKNNLRPYAGRGGRGRWSRNEGRRNHQTKPGDRRGAEDVAFKTFESQLDSHEDSLQFRPSKARSDDVCNDAKEKTYENQRELLEDQLRSSSYECLVCCSRVGKGSPIWSCSTCYNVFHLSCIRKWAASSAVECPPGAAVELVEDRKFWRCPTCQNASSDVPDQYLCFCGKQKNPQFSFEAPHSCGEVCAKKRGSHCRHPCNILCHPGPCPPCTATVNTTCGCGKKSTYVKCNSSVDMKCEETCDKMLNCGNHTCLEVCHKGPCHPCIEEVEQTCHCGKEVRSVPCGSKESFLSSYSCLKKCEKSLDCGNHSCSKVCHLGDCETCLLRPELVRCCACGKSDVEELVSLRIEGKVSPKLDEASEALMGKKSKKKKKKSNSSEEEEEEAKWPRTSCLDPLPSCGQVCGKELQCGTEEEKHSCKRKCHNGPCQSCNGTSKVRCQCRGSIVDLQCTELVGKRLQNQPVKCNKRCQAKLSCGRHKCNQNCCVDVEHLCGKTCKRNLTCGLHQCEEPCHPGNCDRCWVTSFEELTCRCGAEVIYPPVACGTKRPACQKICTRNHACHHPVHHTCHNEPKCPPCVHLVERLCLCKKEVRRNVPCHLPDVRCGNACGKVLPCGSHFCLRSCHKGPCLDDKTPKCTQPCQLSRQSCGHPCLAACHMDNPCPKTECHSKVTVRCDCGRKEGTIPCTKAESASDFNNAITSRFWLSRKSETNVLNSNNKLHCDKECAVYKRNKQLAEAFSLKDPNLDPVTESSVGCVQPNYSDFLKDFGRRNAFFVSQIEHDLQQLVKSTASLGSKGYKCHSFKIMKREQRQVVHELAESYGVDTESQDEEPHRNVVAKATKGKCYLPKSYLVLTGAASAVPKSSAIATARPTTLPPTLVAPKRDVPQPPKLKSAPVIDYFDYDG